MAKGQFGKENGRYSTGLTMSKESSRGAYNTWCGMKQRCLNPNNPKYKRYGGRGITICEDWLTIKGFLEWAIPAGLKHGFTIDRINNDGNYEPSNCRVVTLAENSRKKRTTKISKEDAENIRKQLKEGASEYFLAHKYGVVHGTIWFIANNYTHVSDGECTNKLKLRAKKAEDAANT